MKRSPGSPSSPHPKSFRTISKSAAASPLFCTLPPTCNANPTALADTRELEAHYAKYHAWVCQAAKTTGGICGHVFPDARLLELHHTECHDPIAAVRKDRGEKIFACFVLPSICSKIFLTPKARRLHLIAVHGYPKEYFFAVVNKGVGGLLARWGDGAAMIRGKWKPRPKDEEPDGDKDEEDEDEDEDDKEDSERSTEEEESEESSEPEPTTRGKESKNDHSSRMAMDIDELTTSFQASLSVSSVPSSIQFGRGAKRGSRGGRVTNTLTSNTHRYQLSDRSGERTDDFAPRRGRGGFRGRRGARGGN